jgi:uncharacterized protein
MLEKSIKNNLEEILDTYEEAFNIDELCGFLYGITINSELMNIEEWLPVIFHWEMPEFNSQEEALEIIELLMDAYNQFIQKFQTGNLKFPYDYQTLEIEKLTRVEDWCMGLTLGMKLRGDLWEPDEEQEDNDETQEEITSCVAIVGSCADPDNVDQFFNHKYSTDPKVREEGIDHDKLIAMLFANLPMAIESLTKIAANIASEKQNIATPVLPIRSQKVGRNEPCPCGSGKKFKKCCVEKDDAGGVTIH